MRNVVVLHFITLDGKDAEGHALAALPSSRG
jgi:hypothetical protein